MSFLIDISIAIGIFFVFLSIIVFSIIDFFNNSNELLENNELRINSINLHNILFGSMGIPNNWETFNNITPERLGLLNNLYRKPFIIKLNENSNTIITFNLELDNECNKQIQKNTIRIYNEINNEFNYTLSNTKNCLGTSFIKETNISMIIKNSETFFVYFSSELGINEPNYEIIQSNNSNYIITKYPTEKLTMISQSKIKSLKKIESNKIIESLGNINFNVEIDKL